jgi:hypothetical protein
VLNFLISLVIIVFLNDCGVDTSSSPSEQTATDTSTNPNTSNGGTVGLIDPNPVSGGTTGDSGGTDGGDGGSTPIDTTGDQANSVFDVSGAVLDQYACLIGEAGSGYTDNSISDTSADDRSENDIEYGVEINSKLPLDRANPTSMIVTVFYYSLKTQLLEVWKSIYEDNYRLSVDTAWGSNDETTMYVMTPRNSEGYFGCYRYEFSSLSKGTYTKTKVYRNNK